MKESKKFLKWSERTAKWSERLASWAECNASRAEALLRGEKISQDELDNIRRNKPLTEDDFIALINTDIWRYSKIKNDELINIWQENIRFLLRKLEHGQKTDLIESLKKDWPEFSNANFSKWQGRTHIPNEKYKNTIHSFFNLPKEIDLEEYPLFLSVDPIGVKEQKTWLSQKINELPEKDFEELFPVFMRILKSY